MVLEQVAHHHDPIGVAGQTHDRFGVCGGLREWLLHEAVLAGRQHALSERGVGRDGRRERDRIQRRVFEQVLEAVGEAGRAMDRFQTLASLLTLVAAPSQLAARNGIEVTG